VRDGTTSVGDGVRVRQGVANGRHRVKDGSVGQGSGPLGSAGCRELGERPAVHALEHENQGVLVLEEFVGADDGGVLKFAEGRRFSTKLVDPLRVLVRQPRYDLEHDVARRATRSLCARKVNLDGSVCAEVLE
jgi:hypothetical protein